MNLENNPPQGNISVTVQPDNPQQNMFDKSSHPIALFFYIIFKALALVSYLLGNFFTSNFILIFVTCILALAIDFWTVKNISGRLLVGMRWWSEVDDQGRNQWQFEHKNPSLANRSDSNIFWTLLYVFPVIWVVLAIVALLSFRFQWLLIVSIAIALNYTNYTGYTRCEKDAKQRWSGNGSTFSETAGFMNGFVSNMMTNTITSRLFSRS